MPTFANGESAASVRTKINDAIDKVDGNAAITSVNIDSGSIDGTTIGAASAAAGTFTTVVAGTITADTYDLDAIAATKAVTAVDVFVYDTSKDSDGGAWRKRTQHTSWYNETLNTATRGSRREFPAVAVIVAEASTVTIYDGDDPALPMWMVFNRGGNNWLRLGSGASALGAINGKIAAGSPGSDLVVIDFVKEYNDFYAAVRYASLGDISQRNDALGFVLVSGDSIVNRTVNDVAMTVLPDAPIDPATGLPVPTIAVATDGGVSVIKDDGTVVDITGTLSSGTDDYHISFDAENHLHFTQRGNSSYPVAFKEIPSADVSVSTANVTYGVTGSAYAPTTGIYLRANIGQIDAYLPVAAAGQYGLFPLLTDFSSPTKSMQATITSSYNTGWMNGAIKGAFLSDTDTASLVGSGELVTNGTFDTDVSGWTAASDGRCTISWQSGKLRISNVTASLGYAFQTVSTVVGKTYTIQWTPSQVSTAYATRVYWGNAEGTTSGGGGSPAAVLSGPQSISFVATTTTTYVAVQLYTATAGAEYDFDNVSVKLADADRSVNNKGLIVNGTVTRSAVATGAELVGYSGFSASNYLEQPYNSALDFGTGDFCVMGWVKSTKLNNDVLLERRDATSTGNRIYVGLLTTSVFRAILGTATQFDSSAIVPANAWTCFALIRSAGTLYWYVNGKVSTSVANSTDVSNTSALLRIGSQVDGSGPADQSNLALLRISATAPTAEQIKKIYEDEKFLFQENAACTLYGASDAVTALAHDSDTGLLHVGTSAGRSVFQGLRRVSNTTTAVGTAISASGGLVVEE